MILSKRLLCITISFQSWILTEKFCVKVKHNKQNVKVVFKPFLYVLQDLSKNVKVLNIKRTSWYLTKVFLCITISFKSKILTENFCAKFKQS